MNQIAIVGVNNEMKYLYEKIISMTNNKISLTVHHINTKLTLDITALSVDDNNIVQCAVIAENE